MSPVRKKTCWLGLGLGFVVRENERKVKENEEGKLEEERREKKMV